MEHVLSIPNQHEWHARYGMTQTHTNQNVIVGLKKCKQAKNNKTTNTHTHTQKQGKDQCKCKTSRDQYDKIWRGMQDKPDIEQ